MIRYPDIFESETPHKLCKSTGGKCNPACKLFDPENFCTNANITDEYVTLAEGFWKFQSKLSKHNRDWDLFYGCFHPPKKKESKAVFKAEFPNDVPLISKETALSNAYATKGLQVDDINKWTDERVAAVINGNELTHRMASTDWDWQWYNSAIKAGHKVSLTNARNKTILDKILYKMYGDSYESGGTYKFKKTEKNFIKVDSIYRQIKHMIDIKIEFIT